MSKTRKVPGLQGGMYYSPSLHAVGMVICEGRVGILRLRPSQTQKRHAVLEGSMIPSDWTDPNDHLQARDVRNLLILVRSHVEQEQASLVIDGNVLSPT